MQPPARTQDPNLESVVEQVTKLAGADMTEFFGAAVRNSIDEVLDGPRTGRWDFAQLEKTEKTYVGTKLEIVLRSELKLERGEKLDLNVGGHEVDIKWAMKSQWQIPREAVGELCLCLGGLRDLKDFQVGIVRCSEVKLNAGRNQDQKRTLSAAGKRTMIHLVEPTRLPPNFVAEMDPGVREQAVSQSTIQRRVATMFRLLPRTPIPRVAIATIARTSEGDALRRVRADKRAKDPLQGMELMSSKYGKTKIEALGLPPLPPKHWMAVPEEDLPDEFK